MKIDTLYLAALGLLVVIISVLTFALPVRSMRLAAQDNLLSSALKETSREIKAYTTKNNALPKELSDLEFEGEFSVVQNNPGIINKITYKKVSESGSIKKFQLCGDFKTDKSAKESTEEFEDLYSSSSRSAYVDYKDHPKGSHCFDEESAYTTSRSIQTKYDDLFNDDSQDQSEESLFPEDTYN